MNKCEGKKLKTFKVETLGCKVNQCESENISESIIASGMELYNDPYKADLVIINTCAVTQKASAQSIKLIKKVIHNNPSAKLIVTGCHSQFSPTEIAKIKGIDVIVDNRSKNNIAKKIGLNKLINHNKNIGEFLSPQSEELDQCSATKSYKKTRSMVKIQDGCNSFCAYCVIPYTRGKSRSIPEKVVLKEIKSLGKRDYKEIVLTGINIGNYGKDFSIKNTLYKLLSKIVKSNYVNRIRVSSIEPIELTDEIIQLVKRTNKGKSKICNHFHIPLQSGDNFILKSMNRPYNTYYFAKLVEKILDAIPDCTIGMDIIIGFPGETNESFEKTYNFIKKMQISYLHIFPFSPREGTKAWNYPNKINIQDIKKRCLKMRELGFKKRKLFYQKFLGKVLPVLVENKRNKLNNKLQGFSENYIYIQFEGPDFMYNTIQYLRVSEITSNGIIIGLLQ